VIAVRSALFTFLFYMLNAVLAIIGIPVLLMPRKARFAFIQFYVRSIYCLEKYVLGLDYEVRGREYLPESGPYIVAAKHQSAYETFKLHILWPSAAVILKRELVRIPLWGRFLAASEPIAINRKNIREALRQMADGARRVRDQGRVLVIFPQGTRVNIGETTADKPYRIGVAQMQDATGMRVIPLALNSGLFWPRKGGRKLPGKVVFEFLPPVPANLSGKDITRDLEQRIETASVALENEARKAYPWLKKD
jgi:1-acyl-sn-glycerol-3-phosphate acyltransferase